MLLNSEYKRNYVWHPQYKLLAQDVISSAPQHACKDMGMQRKKQYPNLAYRSNEVIKHNFGDTTDLRARSEEREIGLASKSGPRSRSAEPGFSRQIKKLVNPNIMVQSFPPVTSGHVPVLPKMEEFPNATEPACETTEYKSQFAWPHKSNTAPCSARKSVSMGVIKAVDEIDFSVPKPKLAPIHRPCVQQREKNAEKPPQDCKKKIKTEYKSKYKPFTSYVYVDGQWKKTSRLIKETEQRKPEEPWFVEVVERLQKANEYRWRGHGHALVDLPKVPAPRKGEALKPAPRRPKSAEPSKEQPSKKTEPDKKKKSKPTASKKPAKEDKRPKKGSGGKVWLQSVDAVRPSSLLPEEKPSVVPLTHVRTPEEVTGVKSPDPENWTVPLENSEQLQWSRVNTQETSTKETKPPVEEDSEKPSTSAEPVPSVEESSPSVSKLTSSNVLDRARSRLDQFWGKNK